MPDLSAGRPLLYSKSDRDAFAAAIADAIGPYHQIDESNLAETLLDFLADAGRLLPASSEHREEWTYTATIGNVERHGEDNAEAYETRADVEQQVAFMRQHYPALPIIDVRYVRRDVFTGPWVDRSPTDA